MVSGGESKHKKLLSLKRLQAFCKTSAKWCSTISPFHMHFSLPALSWTVHIRCSASGGLFRYILRLVEGRGVCEGVMELYLKANGKNSGNDKDPIFLRFSFQNLAYSSSNSIGQREP